MDRTVIYLLTWNLIQFASSEFRKRDGAFTLSPSHVWKGTVISKEIGAGDLIICADPDRWNFQAANEVCKDLGFPDGVMLYGTENTNVERLQSVTCIFYEGEGAYCRKKEDKCTKSGWVSCQFPGFIGCYPFDPNRIPFSKYERLIGYTDEMAIEICTLGCRQHGVSYAGIEDGNRCYCGDTSPVGFNTKADNINCMKPCNDDNTQACGGIGHISVYESKLGQCNGTYELMGENWYLTSPGFPGNYEPSSNCFWMFNTPIFNESTVKILGMDLSKDETLNVMSYAAVTSRPTSEKTWSTNRNDDVMRGTWNLDLAPNSQSAGVAFIFKTTSSSRGNRQFIMKFQINNVTSSNDESAPHTESNSINSGNLIQGFSVKKMVVLTVTSLVIYTCC